jgi:hypothetical protein
MKGVSPLTNIYDNRHEETTSTSTTLQEQQEEEGPVIEGMSTGQKMQQFWGKGMHNLKTGAASFAHATYVLPRTVDQNLTKDTQIVTEFIYNSSNHKPRKPTLSNIGLSEKSLRNAFQLNPILTIVNETHESIHKKLKSASNTESFQVKQLIADDTQELIYKMQHIDVAKAVGEDEYKSLMLTIRSIKTKLKTLYDKALGHEIQKDLNALDKYIKSLKVESFLQVFDDADCDGSDKRIKILPAFADTAKHVARQVRRYLNKYSNIHAVPFIREYTEFSVGFTNLYYVSPLKFAKSFKKVMSQHANIHRNHTYYSFDKEIAELEKQAAKFRFEKNATEKTVTTVYDNSQLEADKKNDADVLKRSLYMLMAVPFVIVATYNWYYMIVHRDSAKFATRKPPDDGKEPRPYNHDTRIRWDFSGTGPMQNIMDHLFGSMIFPTHIFNHILLNDDRPFVPRMFSHKDALWSRAGVMCIFSFIIYYILFNVSFKDLMGGGAVGKKSDFLTNLVLGIIIVYYVIRMVFVIFAGSHSEFFNGLCYVAESAGMDVPKLKIALAPPNILTTVLLILIIVILFFISMLSVNIAIMISVVYVIVYSLFGFYLFYSRHDVNKRSFFKDVLHMFAGYSSTWDDLSKVFDTERKEWEDLVNCGAESNFGWAGLMKYVFGKIFTWLWIGVTIYAAVYAGRNMRLEEMKIFGTILVILVGSFFIALAAAWDTNILRPVRDALPKTFVSGLLGWLFARQWGAVLGVALMLIYMFIKHKFFTKDAEPNGEQPVDSDGQPVDSDGQPVNPDRQPVNPDRQPVNPDGQPVNPDGQPVNPDGQPVYSDGPSGYSYGSDNAPNSTQIPPEVSSFIQQYIQEYNPDNNVDSGTVFNNVSKKFPKLSPILDGAVSLVPNDIFNNLLQTKTLQLINNMLDKAPVDKINEYITPYITPDKVEVAQEAIELLKAIPEQIRTDFIKKVLPINTLIDALNAKPEDLGRSLKALEPELQKLPTALQKYGKNNALNLIRHSGEFLQIAKKLPELLKKIKNINPLSTTGNPGLASGLPNGISGNPNFASGNPNFASGNPNFASGEQTASNPQTPMQIPPEALAVIQEASKLPHVNTDTVLQNVSTKFPTLAPIMNGAKSLVPAELFDKLTQTESMQLLNHLLDNPNAKVALDEINKHVTPDKVGLAKEAIQLLNQIPAGLRNEIITNVLPTTKLINALNVQPEQLGNSLQALIPELQNLPNTLTNYATTNAMTLVYKYGRDILTTLPSIAGQIPGLLQKLQSLQ